MKQELYVAENKVAQISKDKIDGKIQFIKARILTFLDLRTILKDISSKELNESLKGQVDAMDLDTAPKLLVIWHLLTELLQPNKRLALSRAAKINQTKYFPKLMADV